MNLDLWNLAADWLKILVQVHIDNFFNEKIEDASESIIEKLSIWTLTKNNQLLDFNGPSSFKPNLSQHQNPRDLSQKIAFLVDMNSDHFRVHLCVGLYGASVELG